MDVIKRTYDVAKKEVVFIILPLMLLFVIKLFNNEVVSFIKLSDFSLAMSIMYGQLLAKSLDVPDSKKIQGRFSTFQVYVFSISMLAMAMYLAFNLINDVSFIYYVFQMIIFTVGVVFYIPISTLMSDLIEEKK